MEGVGGKSQNCALGRVLSDWRTEKEKKRKGEESKTEGGRRQRKGKGEREERRKWKGRREGKREDCPKGNDASGYFTGKSKTDGINSKLTADKLGRMQTRQE